MSTHKHKQPHGHFDNLATMRREVWVEGELAAYFTTIAFEDLMFPMVKFGTFPDLPKPDLPRETTHGICDTCGATDVDLVLVNAPPAVNVCVCAKCLPTTTRDMLRISVADGKYTVVQDASGRLSALRYGEPWRNLVGDNLVHALACEVEELRAEVEKLKQQASDDRADSAEK